MIVLYGATAEVHDRVTRNPGSFEAMLRGLTYLREVNAHYEIQVMPMRANYHQYEKMLSVAYDLSPHVRIGSSWLFLSASGSEVTNQSIKDQRLPPTDVVKIDPPNPFLDLSNESLKNERVHIERPCFTEMALDDRLFNACIEKRRNFHIDPYGGMSFCYYIKDPTLRYDLKQGSFHEAWEKFIPSLKDSVYAKKEYFENCGSCKLR